MTFTRVFLAAALAAGLLPLACNKPTGTEEPQATVSIWNDFNNDTMSRKPPWTICECSYQGVEFGKVLLGDTSASHEVTPGLDYILMICAWSDTACSTQNCLPIASKIEEEVVDGQTRVIALNAPNHQGPCPPEGTAPIPESLYVRILEKWPEYDFKPYSACTTNTQCLD